MKREVKIGLGTLAFALLAGTYKAQQKLREFFARTPDPMKEIWETLPWLVGALVLIFGSLAGWHWIKQWQAERRHGDDS